jgi:hypothetical protein
MPVSVPPLFTVVRLDGAIEPSTSSVPPLTAVRPARIGRLRRHDQHGAVIGRDLADRALAEAADVGAAGEEIVDDGLGEPLRHQPLDRSWPQIRRIGGLCENLMAG